MPQRMEELAGELRSRGHNPLLTAGLALPDMLIEIDCIACSPDEG